MDNVTELTPQQARLRDRLLDPGGRRPTFDPDLPDQIREHLTDRLEPAADAFTPADPLWLNRFNVASVLTCEAFAAADEDEPFTWTVHNARGKVITGTIQRLVTLDYDTDPLTAVTATYQRLATEPQSTNGLTRFLSQLPDPQRAELLHAAAEAVTKFTFDWPQITPAWRPRLNSLARVRLHDRRVVLDGRYDLALGAPRRSTSGQVEARVLIVDLHNGWDPDDELDDLTYLALLETLTRGCPPHRVAAYCPDEGSADHLDVTVEHLFKAADRVVDAAGRLARIRVAPNPVKPSSAAA